MLKDVIVGDNLRARGITENHRGFPDGNLKIFGGDTETIQGDPYTLQISGPPVYNKPDEMMVKITANDFFDVFMAWIIPRISRGAINLCFFHNLNFDLRILFLENLKDIYNQYNDIRFERGGFVIKMLYGRVNQANIWEDLGGYICEKCEEPVPFDATAKGEKGRICTRHTNFEPSVRRNLGKKLRLLDSAAFCPPGGKSLISALKIYDVPYKKLDAPKGLGERTFDKAGVFDPYFCEYALNDARAERALGGKIMDLHQEYDVTTCVSLPQLASRILRHHFFLPKETLQFPPEPVRLASEYSYHAGKNGFYVKRGIYENVYEYDINSAFPKAMRELPQLSQGEYREVKKYMPELCGVYLIDGQAHGAKIPAIFDHVFVPIKEGAFERMWVTGFEIECLLNNPDYDFKIKKGYVWVPDPSWTHSPLREFVDRFFHLKATAPKGPKRDTYKNILNSLYGKFAACVEKRVIVDSAFGPTTINDPADGGMKYWIAGALYHPFVATQITGYVRRDLFRFEKQGDSMHSATDSIKSFKEIPTSNELGGLKKEVFGRCYLFRTKLYLHFSKDTSLCGHNLKEPWINLGGGEKTSIFDRGPEGVQHLCKYALHGFKGNVLELFQRRHELMDKGKLEYEYRHMVNLREGFRRDEKISAMITRKECLTL